MTTKNLKTALTAAADALRIDLEMAPTGDRQIDGEGVVKLGWFDLPVSIPVEVKESIVDADRDLIVLLVKFRGSLYGCLISEGEQFKLTMMLLDGSKLGIGDTSFLLPRYWNRERLYKRLVDGLKVTFEKAYYGDKWAMVGKGTEWMNTYFERKNGERDLHTIGAGSPG